VISSNFRTRKYAFYQVFCNHGSGKASASQAENASSILVARSRLDLVATTDQIIANIAVGFHHCSPLFAPVRHLLLSQHCRIATIAEHHISSSFAIRLSPI
jgi:hypothetical protein